LHQRPRDAGAIVRLVLSWLLVAVLAVDLIASPLHTHRHDGEWSIGGALSASAEHPGGLHIPDKVHAATPVDHDPPGFSHSISALRGHVQAMAEVQSSDEAAAAPFWSVTAQRPLADAAESPWPPDRHRAGSSAFRSLPPDGRAPPLHA
jgi:hypothetical protein